MAATAVRGVFTANLKIRRKPHQGGWVRRSRTVAAACGSGKNKTVGFVQPPSDRQMNLTPKPLHSPPLIIDGLPAAKSFLCGKKLPVGTRYTRDLNMPQAYITRRSRIS